MKNDIVGKTNLFSVVDYKSGLLRFLDQRKLPILESYVKCKTVKCVHDAIKNMVVRGAPAIGVAAAYGMALAQEHDENIITSAKLLKSSRPTAVDLFNAIDFMIDEHSKGNDLVNSAKKWDNSNRQKMMAIAKNGAKLIKQDMQILTHCNTGVLATNGYGTALGVIRFAHQQGKNVFVWVDETRPRFQGALTEWELSKFKIPHKVITDNMAGLVMQNKNIGMVIVGADRIAKNGDTANKIGTYTVAVLAKRHNIPFYVAAPKSTFDMHLNSGKDIKIEERNCNEVLYVKGNRIYGPNADCYNPAFDVTPVELITGFITEDGVFSSVSEMNFD